MDGPLRGGPSSSKLKGPKASPRARLVRNSVVRRRRIAMATPMEGVDATPAAPTKGKVDYGKIEAELEEQAAIARQVRAGACGPCVAK